MADLIQYYGTGRRKSSIARVFLRPAAANSLSTARKLKSTSSRRNSAPRSPLARHRRYRRDLRRAHHGSRRRHHGQADAVKLGIARALMEFNPELRKALKAENLVTRDSRGKERKKYGQKGARARFQFSKR